MTKFWKLFLVAMFVAGAATVVLAVYGAGQGGSSVTAAPPATVIAPAAPIEQPRRSKFNVN